MCGIAGSVNYKLNIPRLRADLLHRGPDEQAEYQNKEVHFHHHRLAIMDIACGKQPMQYGALTIIFNGEIYNHMELRKKFQLDCKTNSDTETILHLYSSLGPGFLNELDGMFAFAIHDSTKQQIFLARDRAGKKPLYYYHKGDSFVFASELRTLHRQIGFELDESNLQQYVRMGYFYKSNTPYQHVKELPAGSMASVTIGIGDLEVSKWWDINTFYSNRSTDDFDTATTRVDELLRKAVKDRLESSDLEVGSFLSGGIDSGLVTAIAKEFNPSLKTFTVSFDGQYDEAPLAKLVADRYKTDHHEVKISFDNLSADVENILANYGEPFFDSSAIPSYYVSKAAKEHLTVILNGDGGDELFGGYRRYVPYSRYDFFNTAPVLRSAASLIHKVLPVSNDKKSKYNFLYRLVDLAQKGGLDTYLSSTIDSFDGYEKYLVNDKRAFAGIGQDFTKIKNSKLSGLQKIMNLDFDNILAGDLLVKMDIATMAHSLEGRSPLLSKGLLEYVPTVPDDFKIRGSQTKYILRTLAERYLPSELIHQPKRGFEIPLRNWVDNELSAVIRDYIGRPNAYCRNFVKPQFIESLLQRRIKVGDEKRAKMIWTLFALEVWYEKVYKGKY